MIGHEKFNQYQANKSTIDVGCKSFDVGPAQNLRSRGSTHRSRQNPLGRRDSPAVRLGNLLCCRALILVIIAASKGIFWILEQPASSTMQYHPLFQRMMKMIPVRRMSIQMGNYGGPTKKPTYLYTGYLRKLRSRPKLVCGKPFITVGIAENFKNMYIVYSSNGKPLRFISPKFIAYWMRSIMSPAERLLFTFKQSFSC